MALRAFQFQGQVAYEAAGGAEFPRSVIDAVSIGSQIQSEVNTIYVSSESVLEIEDFIAFETLPGGISNVEDQLTLEQDIHVFGYESVGHELGVQQSAVFQGPAPFNADRPLDLEQSAVFEFGLRWLPYEAEHALNLSESVGRVKEFSVTDNLSLLATAIRKQVVQQSLNLTQQAEWGYAYEVSHEIEVQQSSDVDLILTQSLSDEGIAFQAVAYFVESSCGRYERNNFHGEGGVAPNEERLEYSSTFLMQSKKTPSDIQVLRNPATDDRRRYSFQRVNRRYIDNTLNLYADPSWPTEQTQLYTVEAIKRSDLEDLFVFLQENLGLEVWIKDWRGVTWNSVVTNPGEVYTEDGEGYWTLAFEVQGTPYAGEAVKHVIELQETISRSGSVYTRSVSDGLTLESIVNRHYNRSTSVNNIISQEQDFTVVAP